MVGGRVLLDLGELLEGLRGQDLQPGVRRLEQVLHRLEEALGEKVDRVDPAALDQLVHGLHPNRNVAWDREGFKVIDSISERSKVKLTESAPVDVVCNLLLEILADSVQLLGRADRVVDEGLHLVLHGGKITVEVTNQRSY